MSLWLSHHGCMSLHQGFINMAQTQMLEEEAYYEVHNTNGHFICSGPRGVLIPKHKTKEKNATLLYA